MRSGNGGFMSKKSSQKYLQSTVLLYLSVTYRHSHVVQ